MGGKPKRVTCFVDTTPQTYESNGFVPTRYHKGGRAEAAKAQRKKSSRSGSSRSHTRARPYLTGFVQSSSRSVSQAHLSESPIVSPSPPMSVFTGSGETSQSPPNTLHSSRLSLSHVSKTGIPSSHAVADHFAQPFPHSPTQAHHKAQSGERSNGWYPSPPNVNFCPSKDVVASSLPLVQQQHQYLTSSYPASNPSVPLTTSVYPHHTYQESSSPHFVPSGYGQFSSAIRRSSTKTPYRSCSDNATAAVR
ncbi:hypothetical protein L218DRAFT_1076583 [Marasmius fiardii PR-910]|nr:hypothetical protein L218DRAFT_1076583 [Marasmius fiardii PR-910]